MKATVAKNIVQTKATHASKKLQSKAIVVREQLDHMVEYSGIAQISMFNFFIEYPRIICRWRGSVFQYIVPEVLLVTTLGIITAWHVGIDPNSWMLRIFQGATNAEAGFSGLSAFQTFSSVLVFLIYFRTVIAWHLYMEGRNYFEDIVTNSRDFAIHLLATLAHARPE